MSAVVADVGVGEGAPNAPETFSFTWLEGQIAEYTRATTSR
jgi:hypothetical protein